MPETRISWDSNGPSGTKNIHKILRVFIPKNLASQVLGAQVYTLLRKQLDGLGGMWCFLQYMAYYGVVAHLSKLTKGEFVIPHPTNMLINLSKTSQGQELIF